MRRLSCLIAVLLAGCAQLPGTDIPSAPTPATPPGTAPVPAIPTATPPSIPAPAPAVPSVPPTSSPAPSDTPPSAPVTTPTPVETKPTPEARPAAESATTPPPAPPANAAPNTAPNASAGTPASATTENGLLPAKQYPWLQAVAWKDLPGWKHDPLLPAWAAWLQSCQSLRRQRAWQAVCNDAGQVPHESAKLRAFFEKRFQPYQVNQAEGGQDGLITGYYEPLLRGSRSPAPGYPYPLLAPPDDLLVVDLADLYPELKHLRLRGRLQGNKVVPYFTRADIEAGKTPLKGREIAWVADPVELFFLQVQGSGRIQFDNGEVMRVGYADQNGHPYRSIGKWLVEQGELTLDKASMQGIKDWGARNPDKLPGLLRTNPSFVFFRELPNKGDGPIGSLGVPLTPERSIAVDPRAIPLGAPVWLATTQPNTATPMQRLVMAQDTGSAIKGNVRADFFWGFGESAGDKAGAMKQTGRMWLMLPKESGNGNGRENNL
jgi:membrane-bound lytic murein transglycosylase A